MAKCSCGAEIVFARSPRGARLPLQKVSPHVYTIDHEANPPEALPLWHTDYGETDVYLSHFLTCPDRARYSGRNKRTT